MEAPRRRRRRPGLEFERVPCEPFCVFRTAILLVYWGRQFERGAQSSSCWSVVLLQVVQHGLDGALEQSLIVGAVLRTWRLLRRGGGRGLGAQVAGDFAPDLAPGASAPRCPSVTLPRRVQLAQGRVSGGVPRADVRTVPYGPLRRTVPYGHSPDSDFSLPLSPLDA